jgi:hypothetical protein
MMTPDKERLLEGFHPNPPAALSSLHQFERNSAFGLPDSYAKFLLEANGGEGFIGANGYVILWRVEELSSLNDAYQVAEYVHGLLLFGSDGGGEAFGFDIRSEAKLIVSVPFVGMDPSLIRPVGPQFTDFLEGLFHSSASTVASDHGFRRKLTTESAGKEVFELHPIILGGSPTDLANKVFLDREKHIQAVQYWNSVIRKQRGKPQSPKQSPDPE